MLIEIRILQNKEEINYNKQNERTLNNTNIIHHDSSQQIVRCDSIRQSFIPNLFKSLLVPFTMRLEISASPSPPYNRFTVKVSNNISLKNWQRCSGPSPLERQRVTALEYFLNVETQSKWLLRVCRGLSTFNKKSSQ